MHKVLVVDDEADARRVLVMVLEQAGAVVGAASSVREAIAALPAVRPDVLVSDLGLPDGSGLEIMRRLRQPRAGATVPVGIALTGYGMEEDVARSRDAGFAVHITKPVNFDRLQEAIERATSRATEAAQA